MFRTIKISREFDSEACGRHGGSYIPNAHMIKNLYLSCPIRKLCPEDYSSLKNLSVLWHDLVTMTPRLDIEIPTLTHLTLREVTITDSVGFPLMFRSVTHLYLPKALYPILPLSPHLTHVVVVFNDYNIGSLLYCLKLLDLIDTLQVIGIQMEIPQPSIVMPSATALANSISRPDTENKIISTVQACSFRDKHKVVVTASNANFSALQWSAWFHGGESIWETAERLLSEREQSKSMAEEGRQGGPAHEP
jgi:hypothetical protein